MAALGDATVFLSHGYVSGPVPAQPWHFSSPCPAPLQHQPFEPCLPRVMGRMGTFLLGRCRAARVMGTGPTQLVRARPHAAPQRRQSPAAVP